MLVIIYSPLCHSPYVPQREERIQFSILAEFTWCILDLYWVSDNVVSRIRSEQELVYHSNVWNAPWSVYYHIKKMHLNCWFSSLLFSSLLFSSLLFSSLLFSSLLCSSPHPTHSPLLFIIFLHSTLLFSSPQILGESQSISESLALSFVRCGVERASNCSPHLNCTVGRLLRL